MGILRLLLRTVTWWNGQTLNTQIHTWRRGQKVGADGQGNIYLSIKKRKPPLGDIQRRGRGQPGQPGLAWLAASHI